MKNFANFEFRSDKDVSLKSFYEKITEAKNYLKKVNNLTDESFKHVCDISEKGYNTRDDKKELAFIGQLRSYEIYFNNTIHILDCFYSNNNDYMEVFTSPAK